MRKLLVAFLVLIVCGCTVEEKVELSISESNSRYLTAAQMYSSLSILYPNNSLDILNAEYMNLLESIQNEESDYFFALNKEIFLNSILDLHKSYEPTINELEETGYLPVRLTCSGKRIFVEQKSEDATIPLYAEILEINGIKPWYWFESEYPSLYNQCKSDADFDYLLSLFEKGYLGTNTIIKYKYKEEIKSEKISYSKDRHWEDIKFSNPKINFFPSSGTNYMVGLINDTIYIKSINFNTSPMLNELIGNLVKDYKKIIIDLRDNTGGNDLNGIKLIEPFLINDFINGGQMYNDISLENMLLANRGILKYGNYVRNEIEPYQFEVDNSETNYKVAVLINKKCQSSCEMVAYYEQQQENTVIIGEATKGAIGNMYAVTLDDGSKIMFPLTLVKIDNNYLHSKGIIPDIIVEYNTEQLSNGNDQSIIVAMEYLNETEN